MIKKYFQKTPFQPQYDRKGVPLLDHFRLINKVSRISLPGERPEMFFIVQFHLLAFQLLNFCIYLFVLHRELPDITGRHSWLAGSVNAEKELAFVRFENVSFSGQLHQLAGSGAGTIGHITPAVVAPGSNDAEQ